MFASNAFAADAFWVGTIYKVIPTSSGDTLLQLDPVANLAAGTSVNERCRVAIVGTDPGANQMLATVLTALSLGKYISVLTPDEPTMAFSQDISRVVLVNE